MKRGQQVEIAINSVGVFEKFLPIFGRLSRVELAGKCLVCALLRIKIFNQLFHLVRLLNILMEQAVTLELLSGQEWVHFSFSVLERAYRK